MKLGRLLRNEYLRIFSNYKIILVLLLFFVGNALLLFFHAERDSIDHSVYKDLKETLSTMSYEDGEMWLLDFYNRGNESEEMWQLVEEYSIGYTYPAYLQKIQNEAEENSTVSIFSNSTFALNNIKATAKDFKKLEDIEPRCIGGYGISLVFSFRGTDVLLFMVMALLIAAVLLEDKKSGMLSMMRATRYGGRSFAFAKIIVITSLSFVLTLLFKLANILEGLYLYGDVSLNATLQSLPGFDKCSYEWSIGQGILFSVLTASCAFFFISLLMFLVGTVSDNYVIYYLVVFLFLAIEYGLFYIGNRIGSLDILKRFNIMSLIDTTTCFSYYNYNFFGQPVHMLLTNVTGVLILSFVILLLGIQGFAKHSYDYRELAFQIGKKIRKPGYGIWKNEAYKIFVGNKVLILLIALFLLMIYFYKDKHAHWYRDEQYYRYYIHQIEGEATDEKYNFMNEERERLTEIQVEYDMYEEMLASEEISYEQYSVATESLYYELEKVNGFNMAYTYVSYIKDLDEKDKGIVYDRGWNYLAGGRDYSNDIHNGIILMLFLILALSGVMTQEDRYHMNALIDTSYKRKGSKTVKFSIAILMILLIYLIVYIPELLWVIKEYGGAGTGYSIHSIPLLSNVGLSCSIFSYFVLVNLIRFLTAFVIGVIIVLSGKLIKNHNVIIIAAIVIFVMPLLLRVMGIEVIDHFSFNRLISGNMMFER